MNKVLDWAKAHPKLSMWVVLGLGMVAIIAYEARDVGLLPGQWIALVIATVLVAGLCVWIIGWEDDEDDEDADANAAKADSPKKDSTKTAAPATATPTQSATPDSQGDKTNGEKN